MTRSREVPLFTYRLRLFSLLGFDVFLDASWTLLAVLIVWTLAVGVFPPMAPGLAPSTYWWMAVVGALGLFASIVLHELAHAVVARRFGMPIAGITLFIFGGVAELRAEPPSPRAEFLMAGAGPLASLALAGVLLALSAGGPPVWVAIVGYLGTINGILALFNLVPAFPLDGGRMLRAALWGWRGDLRWATRAAAGAGSLFGLALIVWGVVGVLSGDVVAGMWRFLIGLFLRSAAAGANRQVAARETLSGMPVARFMTADPVTVTPELPVVRLVEDYVLRHRHRLFPVVRDGLPVGTVRTDRIAATPPEERGHLRVGDIMEPLTADGAIAPDADAYDALARMRETGRSRLLVVAGRRLVGILSLSDLLGYLSLSGELRQPASGRRR